VPNCSECGAENRDAARLCDACGAPIAGPFIAAARTAPAPTAIANGRYEFLRELGEGGKKRVHLARDTVLGREVALALITAEGLDASARDRVQREAQAMGRLGAHPHLVTVRSRRGGWPALPRDGAHGRRRHRSPPRAR
jgi:hypothetical protein